MGNDGEWGVKGEIYDAEAYMAEERTTYAAIRAQFDAKTLEFFNGLTIYNHISGAEIKMERTIGPSYKDTYEIQVGNCIRVSSSWFVGSAVHYLELFFQEQIPGYDVRKMIKYA